MKGGSQSLYTIFRYPALIFAVSIGGLVAALLVAGIADLAACAAVAAPLVVALACLLRRRRTY